MFLSHLRTPPGFHTKIKRYTNKCTKYMIKSDDFNYIFCAFIRIFSVFSYDALKTVEDEAETRR